MNQLGRYNMERLIYIFPLDKNIKILLEEQKYPKKETEPKIIKQVFYKKDRVVLDKKITLEFNTYNIDLKTS